MQSMIEGEFTVRNNLRKMSIIENQNSLRIDDGRIPKDYGDLMGSSLIIHRLYILNFLVQYKSSNHLLHNNGQNKNCLPLDAAAR